MKTPKLEAEYDIADRGDRWQLTVRLGGERRFEALIPKNATVLDLSNFVDHLIELAERNERERTPQ